MKQKSYSLQVLTKAYLDKALDERFGSYDKKMDGKFKLSELSTDIKLENLERKIDEKAKQYRDQILNSSDKLAKSLETMREELEIGSFQMRNKIKDHEKRINVLESA